MLLLCCLFLYFYLSPSFFLLSIYSIGLFSLVCVFSPYVYLFHVLLECPFHLRSNIGSVLHVPLRQSYLGRPPLPLIKST